MAIRFVLCVFVFLALNSIVRGQHEDHERGAFFMLERSEPGTNINYYELAIITSIHRFATNGEVELLNAMLERHPQLVILLCEIYNSKGGMELP